MLTASVDTILTVTGGELLAGAREAVASDLCVDSRVVSPGCVFVAMPGERVDGHEFAAGAIERGARVLLVTRSAEGLGDVLESARLRGLSVVRVPDALVAVQALARYHRGRLHCEVLGVSGSTGKTTTKDFLTAALSTTKRVVATSANRNNELGVPLTILEAGADTDVLVVEMGMRGLGQIAELCEIARPTMALITNVGTSHIELLGSQEAIARAKGELTACLSAHGKAFLNGDDEFSAQIAENTAAPVTYYGLSERCSVRAEGIVLDAESRASFTLVAPGVSESVQLLVPGRHNVYNALGAAAVALAVGVPAERVAEGLAAAKLTGMRMQVFAAASGATIVNDAYNANPTSMRAALETLAAMRTQGRHVAVLGDMAELGSLTELAHFRIGELVARLGVEELVAVGPRARRIADGALAEGLGAEHVHVAESTEAAAPVVADVVRSGDVVLFKASRVMGLERVIDELTGAGVG
jgi:UDP-N-acetylmuramoyl-tripeptide--D-alanyl-D-alanine ligase